MESYVTLLLRLGVNLQSGQNLIINSTSAPVEEVAPVMRLMTRKAYELGARNVYPQWDDGEIARTRMLLAPDAALLLLVPAHPRLFGPIDTAFGHYRRYGKGELDGKLRAAGLQPKVLRHVNPVGALGWLAQARLRKRERMSYRGLDFYDRLVPALRLLDRVPLPVGLSLWAVAKTSGTASASASNA